jgi:hypothetical protein
VNEAAQTTPTLAAHHNALGRLHPRTARRAFQSSVGAAGSAYQHQQRRDRELAG